MIAGSSARDRRDDCPAMRPSRPRPIGCGTGGPPRRRPAGDRPSRRVRATGRSTRWPSYELAVAAGRRLHRARPRHHQGRRARRPPRDRDLRHDRRRRPPGVRRRAARPRSIDGVADHRLVRRGLHARRAQDAAREGAHPGHPAAEHGLRRAVRGPDVPGGHRPARAAVARAATARSASIRRPSTRRTSAPRACRSRSRWSRALHRNRLDHRRAPVFVQSFEVGNLQRARPRAARSRWCSCSTRRPGRTTSP